MLQSIEIEENSRPKRSQPQHWSLSFNRFTHECLFPLVKARAISKSRQTTRMISEDDAFANEDNATPFILYLAPLASVFGAITI